MDALFPGIVEDHNFLIFHLSDQDLVKLFEQRLIKNDNLICCEDTKNKIVR